MKTLNFEHINDIGASFTIDMTGFRLPFNIRYALYSSNS